MYNVTGMFYCTPYTESQNFKLKTIFKKKN